MVEDDWTGPELAGIGALKELSDDTGEIRSMRTERRHLRRGVATALLVKLIDEGRQRRHKRLSLEHGSGPACEPELALYRKHGFANGAAFGEYIGSQFSQFLHLELD